MNHTVSLLHRGIGLRFCMAALVALGLISSAYIQPVLQTVQQAGRFRQGYHNELIICAISSDALSAFIPALAAIPLSAEYLEDIKIKSLGFSLFEVAIQITFWDTALPVGYAVVARYFWER